MLLRTVMEVIFFFFNDTAPTEIYTLSLHDALPISQERQRALVAERVEALVRRELAVVDGSLDLRSEEHTSELQSHVNLVCRLLLEKKKKNQEVQSCCVGRRVVDVTLCSAHGRKGGH